MKAAGDLYADILSYLKKQKEANTFKLARELRMERYKLLNAIAKLEESGAVAVKHGTVKFLRFAGIGKRRKKWQKRKVQKRNSPKKKDKQGHR